MKSDYAIKVENISKKYVIGQKQDAYPTLRDQLVKLPQRLFNRQKPKEFWALKDVSFEVKKGEVLGIIGRNGAGKSTLLKILSRITEPTSGQITMHGKVASLLEVGTGFNPELTGRENVYLNGSIIGMSRKEIDAKFDEIVEFSGVEEFLDTPVKRYSSGMYVRLAFAVSAFLESDILIVDEVLAVGDAEFQRKCIGKMNSIAKEGKTVIFVSHSIPTVSRLCESTIWINKGRVIDRGETRKVIEKYYEHSTIFIPKAKPSALMSSCNRFKLEKAYWVNNNSKKVKFYNLGDSPILRLELDFFKPTRNIGFGFGILTKNNDRFLTAHQADSNPEDIKNELKGKVVIEFKLGLTSIAPGNYRIIIGASDQITRTTVLYTENLIELKILEPADKFDGANGYLWQLGSWKIVK